MTTSPEQPAEPAVVAAAGWYNDPQDPSSLRYWDGSTWTDLKARRGAIARKVTFGQAIAMAFKWAFRYRGRATAGEFWWFFLFNALVTLGLYVLIILTVPTDPYQRAVQDPVLPSLLALALFGWFIVALVVQLPLMVRRLHDKDMTGWLVLLAFVPFGSIIVLILLAGSGNPSPNKYGPVPVVGYVP